MSMKKIINTTRNEWARTILNILINVLPTREYSRYIKAVYILGTEEFDRRIREQCTEEQIRQLDELKEKRHGRT